MPGTDGGGGPDSSDGFEMSGFGDDEELEWDIRKFRLQSIGLLTQKVREAAVRARTTMNESDLFEYVTMLDALFMEIEAYIEPNHRSDLSQRLQDITGRFDAPNDAKQAGYFDQIYQTARGIDRDLNRARVLAGLDMPKTKKMTFGKGKDEQ